MAPECGRYCPMKVKGGKLTIPLPLCCTIFLLYGSMFLFATVTHCYGLGAGCCLACSFAFCDVAFVMGVKSRYGWSEIVIKSSL